MNNLKKIIGAVLLSAIALVHFDGFAKRSGGTMQSEKAMLVSTEADVDSVIDAQTAQVEQMTAEAKKVKMNATAAIEAALEQRDQGKITRAQAAVIIGEQKYAIEKADETLTHVTDQAAQTVAEAEGYLSRFVSGVKSWYYGPEEAREVAQAKLTQLGEDLTAMQAEYAERIKNARGNSAKSKLRAELTREEQAFNTEIQKQKDIAEGRMSSQNFWRSVAKAGAVIGTGAVVYGAYRYFGGEAMPPVSVPGTLTPTTEEPTEEFDVPPTIEDIRRKGQQIKEGVSGAARAVSRSASDIYQSATGTAKAVKQNVDERVEQLRQQSPASLESQMKNVEEKYEEARQRSLANEAAKEQKRHEKYMENEREYKAKEEKRNAPQRQKQQAIADREKNKRDLAEKKRLEEQSRKTPGQLKREEQNKKRQEAAGSGARGFFTQRAENAYVAELEAQQPIAANTAAQEQAKLDKLDTELKQLKPGSSANIRKQQAILKQRAVVAEANKELASINAQLEDARK